MPSMPISCSHYLLHTLKDTVTGTHSADTKYALQKQRETVALTKVITEHCTLHEGQANANIARKQYQAHIR